MKNQTPIQSGVFFIVLEFGFFKEINEVQHPVYTNDC